MVNNLQISQAWGPIAAITIGGIIVGYMIRDKHPLLGDILTAAPGTIAAFLAITSVGASPEIKTMGAISLAGLGSRLLTKSLVR